MSAWELSDLAVRYRDHLAVDGVDLRVEPGERVGVVGASGSGKTSLVRAGLGLIPSERGRIRVLGADVTGWGPSRWRPLRHRVQLLFQDPRAMLHPSLSLGLLLMDSARVHRPEAPPEETARRALASVGLEDRFTARPHELSGGERRRAGVARVAITRPLLLVADEPTVGLDAALKADLLDLLLQSLDPECAVVLLTHDLPVATWVAHRIVAMDRGKIVEQLDRDALHQAEHPAARRLLEAGGVLKTEETP